MSEPAENNQNAPPAEAAVPAMPVSRTKRILIFIASILWFLLTIFVICVSAVSRHIFGVKAFMANDPDNPANMARRKNEKRPW